MKHSASPRFWAAYEALPASIRKADANFVLLKRDPRHPSFKKVGRYWSVRVGLRYRALLLKPMTRVFGSGSARTPIMTG